jgi:hypothetical protein
MELSCAKMTKYSNPVIARFHGKNDFFKQAENDEFTKLVIGRRNDEAIQEKRFLSSLRLFENPFSLETRNDVNSQCIS